MGCINWGRRWVVHRLGARHSRISNRTAGHSGHIVASAQSSPFGL